MMCGTIPAFLLFLPLVKDRLKMKRKLLVCLFAAIFTMPVFAQNDFDIAKNVDIFVSILKELNDKYADEISPGKLTETAIDAMLESLDPYTVYYKESQIEDVRMMTTGQYGGVGALIQQKGKDVVISEPYENTPSQKAGLRAGDVIKKVNGQSLEGKNSEDVSAAMKGQPGSTMTIEVFRPTENKTLTFTIVREEIKMPNIPYSGMIGDGVGYIKLDQFTDKAGEEVRSAFLQLKKEGMRYLILDLRNNGGGLLHEAVNIMNIFVDQNVQIVETKGKIPEMQRVHKTSMPVTDKEIPVVVLVNEHSASASEIVAGAFQDLDRGVIVGKKTFGKGLVQNVLPLDFNTSMKITVAKYYIPSGRCVQNIEYFEKDTTQGAYKIPDSLAVAFKTKHGRTVYDKGGVEPDVATADTILSDVLYALILNNLIFDYANQYHATHPTIPPADQFKVDDVIYADFLNFLNDKEFTYETDMEKALELFKKDAEEVKGFSKIEKEYNALKDKLADDKSRDLETYKEEIKEYLSTEIVVRYYYQKGRYQNMLGFDPEVNTAKELLLDNQRYQKILSPKN